MADDTEATKPIDIDTIIKQAVATPEVPKIYTNGFGVGLSNADIIIVFQRFGPNPVAVVNLSYTLAKTLAQRLGTLVAEFENAIGGQEILTTDRIDKAVEHARRMKSAQKGQSDDVH
jgi:hypothetical protein